MERHMKETLALLKAYGAVPRSQNRHIKWVFPNGQSYTMAATPSDRLASINGLGVVKRLVSAMQPVVRQNGEAKEEDEIWKAAEASLDAPAVVDTEEKEIVEFLKDPRISEEEILKTYPGKPASYLGLLRIKHNIPQAPAPAPEPPAVKPAAPPASSVILTITRCLPDEQIEALLRDLTKSNGVVAKECGMSVTWVERQRGKRGIRSQYRRGQWASRKPCSLSDEQIEALLRDPSKTNGAIAIESGMGEQWVHQQRRKRGIPSRVIVRPAPHTRCSLPEEQIEALLRDPSKTSTMISKECGMCTSWVCWQRRKRGIPSTTKATGPRSKCSLPEEQLDALLRSFKVDEQVATECGMGVDWVYHERRKRGIPPLMKRLRQGEQPSAPAPLIPAAPPAPSAETTKWVPRIDHGIPLPPRSGHFNQKYDYLYSLQPGDSVFVPKAKVDHKKLRTSIRSRLRTTRGWEVATRGCVEDGVFGTRVWRMK
jgi:hypothetical protein